MEEKLMPFWWRRRIVRDHRRQVLIRQEPTTAGLEIATGPYDDANEAMTYGIAPEHDPPRQWGTMDFQNIELVERPTRPGPSWDEVRQQAAERERGESPRQPQSDGILGR
jgi:hypothetical protein